MRRADYMYEYYIEQLDKKDAAISKIIRDCESSLYYIESQLRELNDHIVASGDDYKKIIAQVRSGVINAENYQSPTGLGRLICASDVKRAIFNYIRVYIRQYNRLSIRKIELRKNKLRRPPRSLFKDAVYQFNYNMIKEVLMGGKFRLGHKFGYIDVIEKHRTYYLPGTEVTKAIDWNESKLYKQRLIDQGITPYDSKTAPNGKKWFIYFNEPFVYWYKWHCSPYTKLRMGTIFKPLAYVTVDKEERLSIEENVKTVKEALDTTVFGPIEKLQLLKKRFPNHMLIFRNNG